MTTDPATIAQIAEGLSEAERAALVPFMTFSDVAGRKMKHLGLLSENDGVWHHTPIGQQVAAHLRSQDNE